MPASRWTISVGPRPLLARTCLRCAHLLPASRFNRNTKGYWDVECSACRAHKARADGQYRKAALGARRRRYLATQATSLAAAGRYGQDWTMPELEVLLRNDLTNAEKAGMLGRSYYAVVSAGSLLNRTDELRRVVG